MYCQAVKPGNTSLILYMTKLFVGGFPLDIKEIELAQLIAPYGDILTLKMVRDKKTNVCKGYAFVEMKDRDGAERAAIELDGTFLKRKQLRVNLQPSY